jgi:hypothetical protein
MSASSSLPEKVLDMVQTAPQTLGAILQSAGIDYRGRPSQLKGYHLNVPSNVVNQFPAKRILQSLLYTTEHSESLTTG